MSGSAATQLRWGERFYSRDVPWSFLFVMVRVSLKSSTEIKNILQK